MARQQVPRQDTLGLTLALSVACAPRSVSPLAVGSQPQSPTSRQRTAAAPVGTTAPLQRQHLDPAGAPETHRSEEDGGRGVPTEFQPQAMNSLVTRAGGRSPAGQHEGSDKCQASSARPQQDDLRAHQHTTCVPATNFSRTKSLVLSPS